MITTISEDFYRSLSPTPTLISIENFNLKVEGAGGYTLPYLGYIECGLQIPFLGQQIIEVPALVVPTTDYSLNIPVVVGTNAIKICREKCTDTTDIPDEWQTAFLSLQQSRVGVVKSTNTSNIQIQPMETVTLSGFLRKKRNVEEAVTEQTEGASTRIGVCPRVISLDKTERSQRVPVRIFNMSAKVLTTKPRSDICELHEVKVLRHADLETQQQETIQVKQHIAEEDKDTQNETNLPEGIDLGCSNLTTDQKERLQQFLFKWKDIFSKGITDLGNCDLVKHNIKLSDETTFKEPHRRIPPALFQEVREHLTEMIEAGTIRPSNSPYSSNVVIARKKDGTIRFCIDFRKLNNKTVKDAYAIPRVEDTLHLLAGAKYFTKLDLRSGYWQVEINEKDKHKTAFQVGTLGFYEFNRMPFGLCNAPATFQRLMERCMGELNLRDCLIYLDDVIIFSSTFEKHIQSLESVFGRLKRHNLKLKASKCEFLRSSVTYLGHVVSENGIETDPEKTEAIKTWPLPTTVKDVRAFLGFTGYYRRFIKNYATIARPLNDLLVGHCTNVKGKKSKIKKTPFVWTEKQQQAFDTLKEKLIHPPVLAYADYSLPFKVHTDASSSGLGAVLYQHQDEHDRVVAYASRSLKASEKNYPAHKLEFLALKWAITEKFHDYLYGAKFEVVTDNNPLTYVFTTAKLDATGQRWLAELSNYNCFISYRSGKRNADADGLSRRQEVRTTTVFPEVLKALHHSIIAGTIPLSETISKSDEDELSGIPIEDDIPEELLNGTALSVNDWKKAQTSDRNIKFLIDNLLEGCRTTLKIAEKAGIDTRYLQSWENYLIQDDILYRETTISEERVEQLVLPSALKDDIFKAYHDDLGHQGRDRTTSLIRRRFYWPGMNQYIRQKVQLCSRCVRRKTVPPKAAELVNITSSAPMELVCIDYLSLERSKGGYENILVITDHFSRYAQAIPTRNQTAQTTAKVLFENFFLHYGFPAILHSDKGANFESKVIRKLCEITGMKKSRTTPYHPMGNGMVERFNKTLLNMLGTLSEQQKSDWKAHVPTLTNAYNATEHESTGFSPFFLMYGRHPRLAVDAFLGLKNEEISQKSRQDYPDKLKERLNFAYQKANSEARKAGQKNKKYYNRKVKHVKLEPGDRVLIKNTGFKGKHKLADVWNKEPYIVKGQPIPDIPVYEVKKEHSNSKCKLLHRNMLLPFNCLPYEQEIETKKSVNKVVGPSPDDDIHYVITTSDSSSEETDSEGESKITASVPKYVIPQRRGSNSPTEEVRADIGHSEVSANSSRPVLRRGSRIRKRPRWMRSKQWHVEHRPHVIHVEPSEVVYL